MQNNNQREEAGTRKFSEMTLEEIRGLMKAKVTLTQQVSRYSGVTSFNARIDFGGGLVCSVDRDQFSVSIYNLLVTVYHREQLAQRGPVELMMPCVVYKGSTVRDDGQKWDYYSYDVLAYRDAEGEIIHFTGFFDRSQKMFIRYRKMDDALHVVDRGVTDRSVIPEDIFSDTFVNHAE